VATTPQERPRAIPGSESAGAFVVEAVRAQERVLGMTQGWSEGVARHAERTATATLRYYDRSMRHCERWSRPSLARRRPRRRWLGA
jgi:hypothetical protein